MIGCIADARCGIATNRLAQYLVLTNLRNMLQYKLLVTGIGDNEEVLGRHKVGKTLVGHSQK